MITPLYSRLNELKERNSDSFHMPGHKGNSKKFDFKLDLGIDLTEITETDNLYFPNDIILEAEKLCAECFNARRTLFSAGGATLALQASIMYSAYLSKNLHRAVFADRLCHKSVMNAFVLCDIEPIWIYPEDCKLISKILTEKPSSLILTSIDYYGKFRLTSELVSACHSVGCIVVCDNSHGSHLAFYENAKNHPLSKNADLVIDSAHKTLPCVTGGAYLHVSRETTVDENKLLAFMSIFGSTSPSYLIMASLDYARAYMQEYGKEELKKLSKIIAETRKFIENLGFFVFHTKTHDIFRLTINTSSVNINANDLYTYLEKNNVICEFSDNVNLVLICSIADNKKNYDNLIFYLQKYINENKCEIKPCISQNFSTIIPQKAVSLKSAIFSKNIEKIDLNSAIGRISSMSYSPYPPGIPVIMPGEIFSEREILLLRDDFNEVCVCIE